MVQLDESNIEIQVFILVFKNIRKLEIPKKFGSKILICPVMLMLYLDQESGSAFDQVPESYSKRSKISAR
jgi:hypothetical protein